MAGLTDAEMAALEAKEGGGLTDEQMAALEKSAPAGGDTSGKGYGNVQPGGKGPLEELKEWLAARKADVQSPDLGPAAVMGFTSNLWPRASAMVDALGDVADFNGAYERSLAKLQPLYTGAADKHPVANVLGALAQPNPVAKAGIVPRMLYTGAQGYVQGRAGAPVDNPEAQDVGGEMGALEASTAQALLSGIPGAAKAMAPIFREKAGERAVQAVGARAGITDRLAKMGIAPEEIPDLGNRFLDEGLVPSGLNPLRNPQEQTLERARALMKRSGSEVGSIMEAADKSPAGFRFGRPAFEAEKRLSTLTTAEQDAAGKAEQLIDQIRRQQDVTPGSFVGANRLKSKAYRSVNWGDEAPIAAELHRDVTADLRRSIEDQVGQALGPEARTSLIGANSRFGVAADAEELSKRALSRDVQKQQFSPLRAMVSAAAGAGIGSSGGPGGAGAGAVLAPLVTNAIASRGPNVAAHANRLAEKGAAAVGNMSVGSPAATAAASSQLAKYLGVEPEDEEDLASQNFLMRTGGRPR